MDNFSIVIPCAGLGSRLHSNKPKSLTKFSDGESLLDKQLKLINDVFDFPEINIIAGFQASKLQSKIKNRANIIYNPYFETTNVSYSISLGLEKVKFKNVLVIYGDLYFNKATLLDIKGSGTNSFILTDRKNLDEDEVGMWGDDKVNRMDYGLPIRWGQIAYFKNTEKHKFIKNSNGKEKMLGFEIINSIIDEGNRFDIIETGMNSQICDLDSYRDIVKINKEFI